jgi:aryl-alcohol dehydrogenase-like predicted oxidoreductase
MVNGNMPYNTCIKNGPPVSRLGLGAWQLGENAGWQTAVSEKQAIDMVHYALDHGINFFDTAPNYGNGTSELRLGTALRGTDRSKIVINTKFGHTDTGTQNYHAGYIRTSLEGSLKRLQTDYVDSLIIHNPPIDYLDGNRNAHYDILETLVAEGKIKAYGASLDTCEEMKLFMDTTNGSVIEAFFNILHQDAAGAFDMAREKEVAIIVKVPLDSGWLTGKYTADSHFNDIRRRWSREDIGTRAALVKAVEAIAGDGIPLAHTAIAFCLAYEAVTTVIPGNASLAQLELNLAGLQAHPMNEEIRQQLEAFYRHRVKDLQLPW